MTAENSGKPLGSRGPNPAGELTALPQIHLAGGDGA